MSIWTVFIVIFHLCEGCGWQSAASGLWRWDAASAFGIRCANSHSYPDHHLSFLWRKQRVPLRVSGMQDFCVRWLVDLRA